MPTDRFCSAKHCFKSRRRATRQTLSSNLAVALSPTSAMEGQLERPISEVNYQNTYMMQYMSRCWKQIQNFGDRVTSLENRFGSEECPNCGREIENSTPESEAWDTESEDSDADTFGVVSEKDTLRYSTRREEEEDESRVNRNFLAELSPELTNVLSAANCITVFRLASQYKLKALSDAAQDVICKNLKDILKVPTGKACAASGTSLIPGSELEQRGVLPRYPSSVDSLSPGSTLDQLMSEVKQLNAFMGTVARSVTSFEDRFQAMEHSLQDQNTRLEGQENSLGIQKSMFEEEISELKSRVSSSGNLGQLISQFTSVVTREQHLKSLEDQNKELENQVKELKDQASNLKDQNAGLEFLIRKVDIQRKELKDQNKNIEDQKRKVEERISKLEQQKKELEDQARKLQDQNSKQEEQIKGLKSEVQELKTRYSDSVKGKTEDVTSQSTSPITGRDILFVMGGYNNFDMVETLDPTVGRWVSHKIPDTPSEETWIGSLGHKVLVLEKTNERFRSLDILTREWTHLQYLPQHRDGYTVAAFSNQVYVLGGVQPHSTRCDRYDVQTDRWEETTPLWQGRWFAASDCHAGKLYCSGGRSVPGGHLLSSLEVLDPRGNSHWASQPSMGVGRSEHCLVSCGRFLWAIGGHDSNSYISDVEKYYVQGRQWSSVRPLHMPRAAFSASVAGGRVHIMGGWTTGNTFVQTVEVYDEENDQWSSTAPLHTERYYHGSCLVRTLPNSVADKLAVTTGHVRHFYGCHQGSIPLSTTASLHLTS